MLSPPSETLRVGDCQSTDGARREVSKAALRRAPSATILKSPSCGAVVERVGDSLETNGLLQLRGECSALIVRNLVDRHQAGFRSLEAGQWRDVFSLATMAMGGAPPVWKRVLMTLRGLVNRRSGAETALAGMARLRNPLRQHMLAS